ncbi:MAG: nucleotidyltransferase domain-containing protein [Cyclobacteriaceae bacterium]|nr:nucleotidyltransferase domain-containing protein [Cyclobacteriaceae bacterium]UYN86368.1 MAG: nucleotidyltransferase domain-containing protein [Cyclobacteriaceae bacterium]
MQSKDDILDYLRKNKPLFQQNFHVKRIGLIGSFSRDEQHKESDIDLIAEFEPGTKDLYLLKARLRRMMEKQFERKVEICREKYLKPYYRKRILKDAIYV